MFKRNRGSSGGGLGGNISMGGNVLAQKVSGLAIPTLDGDITMSEIKEFALPHNGMSPEMQAWKRSNMVNIQRGLSKIIVAHEHEISSMCGILWAKKIDGLTGEEIDYGIVSTRKVTQRGCSGIVAVMAGATVDTVANTVLANFFFHGIGTGNTAEDQADTALVTELTTEYNPNSTRATGTHVSSGTNTTPAYQTVGTNTLDSGSPAVTEHGIFSASSAGILLDRSVFSAINLVGANGDALQTTYTLTFTPGG